MTQQWPSEAGHLENPGLSHMLATGLPCLLSHARRMEASRSVSDGQDHGLRHLPVDRRLSEGPRRSRGVGDPLNPHRFLPC